MPNWCYNTLRVTAGLNLKEFARFKQKSLIEGEDMRTEFTFAGTLPMPTELDDTKAPSPVPDKILVAKYGADNWYTWCVTNWGTKWNASSTEILLNDEDTLEVSFSTAWNAPTAWLTQIAKDWPGLSFDMDWIEESNAFCGRMIVEHGVVKDTYDGEPSCTDENGRPVIWASEPNYDGWKYSDTDEYIMDEDFYPANINNPFLNI